MGFNVFPVSGCNVVFSCTDDTAETTPNNNNVRVIADDSGDPISIPPPKP